MESFLLPQLHELQAVRKTPAIVYSAPIDDDAVRIVYECLKQMGPTERLDLVLITLGGSVATARRLALLLREFTQHLTILVPYRARSAGTLLCLSADELILGPMAELGPIDAQINATGSPPSDAPGMISAQDIRVFRQMAEDWFGVDREKDRLQVLALIAQRVFPPSLSSFYRADRLTRQAANELLRFQLPDVKDHLRQQIVEQLVDGYNGHDHIITRTDAQALGLRVRFTSPQEEILLWDLFNTRQQQFLKRPSPPGVEGTIGLVMSTHFCARQILRWVDNTQQGETERNGDGPRAPKTPHSSWEIDGE